MELYSPILTSYLNNNSQVNKTAANYTSVSTKSMPDDKFENQIKSKQCLIVAGSIGAGLAAFGGFAMLAKKGKLGESCKEFADNLFKFGKKNIDEVSPIKSKTPDANTKKFLGPQVLPATILEDGKQANRLKVSYNPKSVEADVADWKKLYSQAPREADHGHDQINLLFDEFEIKPHNYADDTSIYIRRRDPGRDFSLYKLENGEMQACDCRSGSWGIAESDASLHFEMQPNGRCMQTGKLSDGRKYATFAYFNGETCDGGRRGYETIMLVSNGQNFTQSQKDLISVVAQIGDRKFTAGKANPFSAATITPSRTNPDSHTFRTSKNMLLSVIKSWKDSLPKFDVDNFVQKNGDTFRTGYKSNFFGKDMIYLNNY